MHVARSQPDTDIQGVIDWIRWLEPEGLTPAAYPMFVGGIHHLPEGGTAYFVIDLEPGRHLFVSQYSADRGVLQEVTVRE